MECKDLVYIRVTFNCSQEIAMYKLDVAGVQEVRWDKRGAVRRGDYIFFLLSERRMKSRNKH